MRLQPTIILAVLLASCATPPFQQGGSYLPSWHSGSPSSADPGSRQRRPGRSEAEPAKGRGAEGDSQAADYRVASDGTVGCADPQALRQLRDLRSAEKTDPRALAQAHRDGHCMTVFRASRWKLESAEGELMQLRLLNPGPGQRATTLYFLRGEVEGQS